MRRKTLLLSLLVLAIGFCSLSFRADEPTFKNLKILPKSITHDELMLIMKSFNTALGVKCNFCHAQSKTDAQKLDFASDENTHKGIARYMMKMTKRINKKFFKDDAENQIACYTCHRGDKEPKQPPKETLED